MICPLRRVRLIGCDEHQLLLGIIDTNNGMQRALVNTMLVQQHAGQGEILIIAFDDLTMSQKTFDILLAVSLEHSAGGMNAVFDSIVGEVSLKYSVKVVIQQAFIPTGS